MSMLRYRYAILIILPFSYISCNVTIVNTFHVHFFYLFFFFFVFLFRTFLFYSLRLIFFSLFIINKFVFRFAFSLFTVCWKNRRNRKKKKKEKKIWNSWRKFEWKTNECWRELNVKAMPHFVYFFFISLLIWWGFL